MEDAERWTVDGGRWTVDGGRKSAVSAELAAVAVPALTRTVAITATFPDGSGGGRPTSLTEVDPAPPEVNRGHRTPSEAPAG